jgi:hypothetical protein
MKWRKLGCVYTPTPLHPLLQSHVTNPLPVWLTDDVYRVFYSGRDAQKRSSVGYIDLDIVTQKVVAVHAQPVFTYGPVGSYYAAGLSIGGCYTVGDTRYMLFMGWQNPPDGRWRGDIGRLIVSADLHTLTLADETPLIGVNPTDPVSLSYPWVLGDVANGYRMWYGSTHTWDGGNGEMIHAIHHATSCDGEHWDYHGLAVPFARGIAQAFSRPTVVGNDRDGYDMWFSYRSGTGQTYRIGYASSEDGVSWRLRLDEVGIDVSDTGWDSDMIEYPYVLDHKGVKYMLYNGNGYGASGLGLAICEN